MINPLRTLFLIIALTGFHGATAFCDTQSKPPMCIMTENGWTFAIWPNGGGTLLRTGKPRTGISTIPGVFDYLKLVEATKAARNQGSVQPTRLNYYLGQFDRPDVRPLPELPYYYKLLNQAQMIFEGSKNQKTLNLLRNYPLRIE